MKKGLREEIAWYLGETITIPAFSSKGKERSNHAKPLYHGKRSEVYSMNES